ncbi:FAD:protein FMN transferase [Colwellia sp. RE-S-Sl-9]
MKYLHYLPLFLFISSYQCLAQWHEKNFHVMGTEAKVQFWHEDFQKAQLLINAVENEMERINQTMSPYIETSDLSVINNTAAIHPVKISTELFNLLKAANDISRLSHGAFDITYASVGYQYQYRNKIKPNEKAITDNLNKINYQGIILDQENQTVSFSVEGMKIDLGGIAKGYAVKNCLTLLKESGVNHGLVSAGGDTGLLGDKRGRPWIVGIKHPRAENKTAVHLPLENEAISTSGDYERYFIEDGERYHHILNPKTGKSAKEVVSVSVIGDDPTVVDALSTTLFVLGLQPAMKLIDSLEGYEAIIIDKKQTLHFSKGLTQ